MKKQTEAREERKRRRMRRTLIASRRHMADPNAKLPRLLAAYAELRTQSQSSWVLPDS
ncbi:MAG: hypothetical protein AAF841_10990 [Pseudomonadota bacterium]